MTTIRPGESELVRVERNIHRPPEARRPSLDVSFLAFMLAHIPLGLAMKASPGVATVHGLLTVAVVFIAAFMSPGPSVAVFGTIYLACSDVLWRMTGAAVPWEASKYGLAFVAIIILLRFHKRPPPVFVIWYLLLLLPGVVITALTLEFSEARNAISFNVSGPFALACGVALFSVIRFELHEFRRLTYLAVAPIAGMWAIALQALLQTQTFSTNSSKEAVGGFGPNQVSTMLGFGALMCLLWALRDEAKIHRVFLAVAGLVLLVQSMLTFSRGGLYNAAVALFMVALLYVRRPSRILLAAGALAVVLLAFAPVFDEINGYTGGALESRFRETDVTGRDDLASADLALWEAEPITGVGIGQSKTYRGHGIVGAAAHTEFTRVLAEHGTLGLLALGSLGMLAVRNLRKRAELWEQAWSLALMVWTAAAMTNAAMRVAAVSLAFALASARLIPPMAGAFLPRPNRSALPPIRTGHGTLPG